MKEYTAVEWLIKELRNITRNSNIGLGYVKLTQGHIDYLEYEAKIIEEKQLNRIKEDEFSSLSDFYRKKYQNE